MFNCAKYLCGESEEVFIPLPADISPGLAMRRIKSHASKLRTHATCNLIYCCDSKGHGLRLVHVILSEAIKKRKKGVPVGYKRQQKLELLDYIAKAGDDYLKGGV